MKISRYMAILILLATAVAGCKSPSDTTSPEDAESKSIAEADTSDSPEATETKNIAETKNDIDFSNAPPEMRKDYIDAYKKIMANKVRAVEHLQTATALKNNDKLIEALGYAQTALKLDSKNKQAQELVAELLNRLGASSYATDKLQNSYINIRAEREYAKREIAGRLASGLQNMEKGHLTEAINDFEEVMKIVSLKRSILDADAIEWGKTARHNRNLARDRQRDIDKANLYNIGTLSNEQLKEIRRKEMENKANVIARYTEQMEQYRNERRYKDALRIMNILLREDMNNRGALQKIRLEILDEYVTYSAKNTHHKNTDAIERLMLDIDRKNIPIPDLYRFDKEYWVHDIKPRAEKIIKENKMVEINEEDQHVSKLVNNRIMEDGFSTRSITTASGSIGNPNIQEVVNYLNRSAWGIEFKVSTILARDELGTKPLDLNLPGKRSLKTVLNLIAEDIEVSWEIEDGMVFFKTHKEIGQSKLILRHYEVGDITHVLHDFKGANVDMGGDDEGGPEFDPAEEHPNPFEGGEDVEDIEYNIEALIELIIKVVPPSKEPIDWLDLNASPTQPAIWKFQDHRIYVRALPETQEEIDQLLNKIRKLWGIMVNIEARFITVEREFLESVGVDWRDLGAVDTDQSGSSLAALSTQIPNTSSTSGMYYSSRSVDIGVRASNIVSAQMTMSSLSEGGGLSFQAQLLDVVSFEAILQAVRQDANRQLLVAPRITCFNTQQASMFVGIRKAYVKEWDNGGDVSLPVMDFVAESTVFDVRPVVSHDRKYVTLYLRPTITFPPTITTERNIVVIEGLGEIPQDVELPEQEVHKFRTAVMVPDGGTVLICGLSRAEKKHIQTRIPLLHRIPILGFFFRAEARGEFRSQIMILITVRIIIADEKESDL